MITLRNAILIAIGLIVALAWAVMPPQSRPRAGAPITVQKKLQCPPGSTLRNEACVRN